MSIKVHGYDLKEIYQGLGAPCRVEALKDQVYEGHLHAIDPQTHTVLLIQLPKDNTDDLPALIAVRSDAITKVTIADALSSVSRPLPDFDSKHRLSLEEMDKFMDAPPQLETICRPELVKERREKLIKLFENHRIPVESDEGSTIRIMDVVTIRPPYDVASTDGPSTVVRDRVRDMVHGWIQQGLL
ncbi:hypothetical protein BGW42_002771 [Actinomortierella wolfii]|nr:hypothetical protein BGW42_002771 [Actinomortierella wolfii]